MIRQNYIAVQTSNGKYVYGSIGDLIIAKCYSFWPKCKSNGDYIKNSHGRVQLFGILSTNIDDCIDLNPNTVLLVTNYCDKNSICYISNMSIFVSIPMKKIYNTDLFFIK